MYNGQRRDKYVLVETKVWKSIQLSNECRKHLFIKCEKSWNPMGILTDLFARVRVLHVQQPQPCVFFFFKLT